MYFSFFKLKKWGKKTAAARRHNCAVLPLIISDQKSVFSRAEFPAQAARKCCQVSITHKVR